eukprot:CAMPEP_0114977368 /NCGR_PEP_ID=MMETSP0216-20121206/3197_1 /TAXON_ID=223996 /ORGANISM="Protocruzia adherens, Strain Boccale" /LENGTH=178 /DNA_ID=CAMNT_0002338415 /DNA_START=107 /DNA_END=643 /DNA_ORIENTATION=-
MKNRHRLIQKNGLAPWQMPLNFYLNRKLNNERHSYSKVFEKALQDEYRHNPTFMGQLMEQERRARAYGERAQQKLSKIKDQTLEYFEKVMKDRQSVTLIERWSKLIVYHINNYHRSLQELVEGHREVTTNKDFQFEDGETVQNKLDRFEKIVRDFADKSGYPVREKEQSDSNSTNGPN